MSQILKDFARQHKTLNRQVIAEDACSRKDLTGEDARECRV
jgi:hypothetical protein